MLTHKNVNVDLWRSLGSAKPLLYVPVADTLSWIITPYVEYGVMLCCVSVRFFQCNPAGCLFELLVQLAVIMVGKQILNNFIEVIVQ